MLVKIKKLNEKAVIPSYASAGDAGLDLTATSVEFDEDGNAVYGTGLAVEIPEGYVGLLFPRSSISKKNINLTNSVGVIDSGYRGEIMFKFKSHFRIIKQQQDILDNPKKYIGDSEDIDITNLFNRIYKIGERIGQLIILPYPTIEFQEVEELSTTERGKGGYGSTGN